MRYPSYANTDAANDDDLYRQAKRIVLHKLAFYSNLIIYLITLGFMWFINLYFTPRYLWAIWPTLGWGLAILIQALHLFLHSQLQWRRGQMIKDEMRKMGKA